MPVTPDSVQRAVKKLREDPTDSRSLKIVLKFVEEIKQDYFKPGESYAVPLKDGKTTVKVLKRFLGPCIPACYSRGCPGILQFEDGHEACPFPDVGPLIRRAPPTVMMAAVQKIDEVLHSGKKRASIELVDGRWVHFKINNDPPKPRKKKRKKRVDKNQ